MASTLARQQGEAGAVQRLEEFLNPPALTRASLAPSSFKQYQTAVRTFLNTTHLTPDTLLRLSTSDIDRILCDYIHLRFAQTQGLQGRGALEHLRCGLAFFIPRLTRKLNGAKRLLVGWRRHQPPSPAPPIPWPICVLLSATLLQRGMARPAIAMLTLFHCYLRVGEMVKLRVGDVRIPRNALAFAAAASAPQRPTPEPYANVQLHLRTTKTRDNQTVIVENKAIAQLLHRCIYGRSKDDSVFDIHSTNEFRYKILRPLLRDLDLSSFNFRPHSFRHGGATHDYAQCGRSAEYVQRRGRWAATKSADHYIQTLQALDLSETLPPHLYKGL
jgi:integrase